MKLKIAKNLLDGRKYEEAAEGLKRLREFIGRKPLATDEEINGCPIEITAKAIINSKGTEATAELWKWFSLVQQDEELATKRAEEQTLSQSLEHIVKANFRAIEEQSDDVTTCQIAERLVIRGYKIKIPGIRYHLTEYRKIHPIESSKPGKKYRLSPEEYSDFLIYIR